MDKTYGESVMRTQQKNVLWHLKIPGVSNNTIEIPEQEQTTSCTPNNQAAVKTESTPNTLYLALCWVYHWAWRTTSRRAIKEGSKVINLDWVNH